MKLLISIICLATLTSLQAQQVAKDGTFHFGPWEAEWGYAQGRRVGNTLYMSGTTGRGATMEEQVKSIYATIGMALKAYGLNASHVVKEVVYATDMEALQKANAPRMSFYDGNTPAATWIQIERLFQKESMLEVEVVARFDVDAPE